MKNWGGVDLGSWKVETNYEEWRVWKLWSECNIWEKNKKKLLKILWFLIQSHFYSKTKKKNWLKIQLATFWIFSFTDCLLSLFLHSSSCLAIGIAFAPFYWKHSFIGHIQKFSLLNIISLYLKQKKIYMSQGLQRTT